MKTVPATPILPVMSTPTTRLQKPAAADKAALAVAGANAPAPARPDFTSMTKADFADWGKKAFARGEISLDDLLHYQVAGGDFDGTGESDTGRHNFVAYFEGLVRNEIECHRENDPKGMIRSFRHALANLKEPFSRSV